MAEHQVPVVLSCVAGVVFVAQIVLIPFRKRRLARSAGRLVMPLENTSPAHVCAAFVLCAAIVALTPFRDFSPLVRAVLLLCALFGERFAANEALALGRAGVYENAIVSGTNAVFFDDIFSLPTLAYEDDPDTTMVDRQTLQIMKKNKSTVTLVFGSEKTRAEALAAVLGLRPALDPAAQP